MPEIRDRAREKIAEQVCEALEGEEWFYCTKGQKDFCYLYAKQILSIPEIAVVDREAKPKTHHTILFKVSQLYQKGFETGRETMAREMIEDGWVKEDISF